MDWLEITIDTQPGSIDAVAARLTAGGFADLVLEDQGEFESFLDQNRDYWDYIDEDLQAKLQGLCCIKLYLEDGDAASMAQLQALLDTLRKEGLGELALHASALPQTDWEESWKENYPPQKVGKRLVVLPYWLADTDTQGRLPVILDPGLTFGTGAHPSTQMVMETMEEKLQPGARCLDLGSGSGILSIAALRLGASAAAGVDVDPKAEDIARENAAYNGFGSPEFFACTGNVTTDKKLMQQLAETPYDVVLVNIVADVIIGLAEVLPAFMHPESILICSGILDTRLDQVVEALTRAGLTVTDTRAKEDWRCVSARRSYL